MRLIIIAVGHKMPDWVSSACNDYLKRMPSDCSIELKEIKPDLSPAKEAIKIAAAIPKGIRLIALDERGKDLSTQGIAEQLAQWRQDGGDVAFLIGGADGLDASLKQKADAIPPPLCTCHYFYEDSFVSTIEIVQHVVRCQIL